MFQWRVLELCVTKTIEKTFLSEVVVYTTEIMLENI